MQITHVEVVPVELNLSVPYRVLYEDKVERAAMVFIRIDTKDFEFYVRLGHEITDHEVAFRKRIIRGMSAKDNAEITTNLTRAANLFRGYILRRLFQQKIQTRIQRSLSRTKT
jgi:hypothetical protein